MVSAVHEHVRPLRRVEYDRLVSLGIFDGERIELIDGELRRMSPIGPPHLERPHERTGEAGAVWVLEATDARRVGHLNPKPNKPTPLPQRTRIFLSVQVTPPRSSRITNHIVSSWPEAFLRATKRVSGSSPTRTSSSKMPSVE
jgi:hypothetical protein